jgi:cell division protein FtsZ
MIELASGIEELHPRITVIGVGGAGGNAVANMMLNGVKGVTFVVANTDAQALQASPVDRILQLGRMTTEGLGAGSRAEIGKAAAEESLAEIEDMLEGAHMCFVAAGMGGGTGSGAAPVIAEAARAKGILTVGVATKPFAFEGRRRAAVAEAGLEELEKHVDTLIVIPNQNLFRVSSPATTFKAAFDLADDVLQQGVRGITDLMVQPGLINLDFADVRTIMANPGKAMMGTGEACGDDRALRAAEQAIANPLLDEALRGASGLIISITGGDDMLLMEVDEVASHIKAMVDPDADIIWGSAFDQSLAGRIRVSVVATGIDGALGAAAAVPAVQAVQAAAPVAQPETATTAIRAPVFAPAFKMPEQVALPLAPPEAEMDDDELLLTIERKLILVAPLGAGEVPMVDPFALCASPVPDIVPEHSPTLFERMAMLARGVAQEVRDSKDGPPMPALYRGRDQAPQRIARAA